MDLDRDSQIFVALLFRGVSSVNCSVRGVEIDQVFRDESPLFIGHGAPGFASCASEIDPTFAL